MAAFVLAARVTSTSETIATSKGMSQYVRDPCDERNGGKESAKRHETRGERRSVERTEGMSM